MTIDTRDELNSRSSIPHMTLCPPDPTAHVQDPAKLSAVSTSTNPALDRFHIAGNAIITGGTGDMGIACARGLLEHGVTGVALFDVTTSPEARARVAALERDFPSAKIISCHADVTSDESLALAVKETVDKLSPDGGATPAKISTVLAFAGIVNCIHAHETSPSDFRRVVDVNLTGCFLTAQAVRPHLAEKSSIVLCASFAGQRVLFPQPQIGYNASKAGVVHMAKCLAAEWAHLGVRVNSISPGYMDTILNAADSLEETRRIWAERCPMGRMGRPEEVVGLVVLLASGAGSYLTGANFVVDGGQSVF